MVATTIEENINFMIATLVEKNMKLWLQQPLLQTLYINI
jgi:hypothetical protein